MFCALFRALKALNGLQPARIDAQWEEAKMKNEYLDGALIQDLEVINEIFADVLSLGQLLVCHGCDDLKAVIAGFLVHDRWEQAWALCEPCLRELRKGLIA